MNWKLIKRINIINSIRLNYYYFGYRGLINPYILVSKNLKILRLSGKVIINNKQIGCIKIGFGENGIIDKKYCRASWENTGIIEFEGTAFLGGGGENRMFG